MIAKQDDEGRRPRIARRPCYAAVIGRQNVKRAVAVKVAPQPHCAVLEKRDIITWENDVRPAGIAHRRIEKTRHVETDLTAVQNSDFISCAADAVVTDSGVNSLVKTIVIQISEYRRGDLILGGHILKRCLQDARDGRRIKFHIRTGRTHAVGEDGGPCVHRKSGAGEWRPEQMTDRQHFGGHGVLNIAARSNIEAESRAWGIGERPAHKPCNRVVRKIGDNQFPVAHAGNSVRVNDDGP